MHKDEPKKFNATRQQAPTHVLRDIPPPPMLLLEKLEKDDIPPPPIIPAVSANSSE